MSETKSVMIVGVGGQGTLLASKVLGQVLMRDGHDVKVSEVHGMSQRGGSVVTYVRYGKSVASPVIEQGEADVILAFEELEAARYLPYLKEGGLMLVNRRKIDPMPVITGAAKYPEEPIAKLKEAGIRVIDVDASELAQRAGSVKAVNTVLLGLFCKHMHFDRAAFEEALEAVVPQKVLELNKQAFAFGFDFI